MNLSLMDEEKSIFEEDEDQNDFVNDNNLILQDFLLKNNIQLSENINIINPNAIQKLTNSFSTRNNIFIEYKANIYYSFVIMRKFIKFNDEFLNQYFRCINKLVHPLLQLYLGLVIEKNEKINDLSTESTYISNQKLLVNQPILSLSVVLEQPKGISLDQINTSYFNLKTITQSEIICINYKILQKICEGLLFIHNSHFPYLTLNPKNLFIDFELISNNYTRIKILENENYILSHLVKICNIGVYSIFFSVNFTYDNLEFSEECFLHPMILGKIKNGSNMSNEFKNKFIYIRYDIWSFMVILIELLGNTKHNECYNISEFKEIIYNYNISFQESKQTEFDFLKHYDKIWFKEIHNEMIKNAKIINDEKFIDELIDISFNLKSENTMKDILNFLNENEIKFEFKDIIDNKSKIIIDNYELKKFANLKEANELIIKADLLQKELLKVDENLQKLELEKEKIKKNITIKYKDISNNKSDSSSSSNYFHVSSKNILYISHEKDVIKSNINNINDESINFKKWTYNEINEVLKEILIMNGTALYYSKLKKNFYISGGKIIYKEILKKDKNDFYSRTSIYKNNSQINQNDFNYNRDEFKDNENRKESNSSKNSNKTIGNKDENIDIDIDNNKFIIDTNDEVNEIEAESEDYFDEKSDLKDKIENILSYSLNKSKNFKVKTMKQNNLENFHKRTKLQINIYNQTIKRTVNENSYAILNNDKKMPTSINLKRILKSNLTIISLDKKATINDKICLIDDNKIELNKNFYFLRQLGLIKRSNHSILEYGDNLFIVGGDQDKSCEIYDIYNDSFNFFEELNTKHINPVLFVFENNLHSLNINKILSFKKKIDIDKMKKKEKIIFCEKINLHKLNYKWIPQDVDFLNLLQIPSNELIYWKSIYINECFIMFLFSGGIEFGKFYISNLYISEMKCLFEKPKTININHKLFFMIGCIFSKVNIFEENSEFIMFDELNSKVMKINKLDLISS